MQKEKIKPNVSLTNTILFLIWFTPATGLPMDHTLAWSIGSAETKTCAVLEKKRFKSTLLHFGFHVHAKGKDFSIIYHCFVFKNTLHENKSLCSFCEELLWSLFHQYACAVVSKFLCLTSLYAISHSIQVFSSMFLRSWTYRPALPGLHAAWNPSAPSWELWWMDDTHYIVILYHFRWHGRHQMFVNPCVMDNTRWLHPCVMHGQHEMLPSLCHWQIR